MLLLPGFESMAIKIRFSPDDGGWHRHGRHEQVLGPPRKVQQLAVVARDRAEQRQAPQRVQVVRHLPVNETRFVLPSCYLSCGAG